MVPRLTWSSDPARRRGIVSEAIYQASDKDALLMCKNSHQTGQSCEFDVQKITSGDGVGPGTNFPRRGAKRPDAGRRQKSWPQPRHRGTSAHGAGRRTSDKTPGTQRQWLHPDLCRRGDAGFRGESGIRISPARIRAVRRYRGDPRHRTGRRAGWPGQLFSRTQPRGAFKPAFRPAGSTCAAPTQLLPAAPGSRYRHHPGRWPAQGAIAS